MKEVAMRRILNAAIMSCILMAIAGFSGCVWGDDDGTSNPGLDKCTTPAFSPGAGEFTSDQNISISTSTQGATIYYTTDNSAPSTSSALYSAPISVSGNGANLTIRAIAVKTGMSDSEISNGTFTINYLKVASPRISPAPVKFNSSQTIIITCATDGATIHYTIDGTDPSETTGTALTNGTSFTLSSTSTVKAIALKPTMLASDITSVNYTFQQWTWVSGDNTVDQPGV